MSKPAVWSWRIAPAVIAVQCGVLTACTSGGATSESDGGSGTRDASGPDASAPAASGPAACSAAGGSCIAIDPGETCSKVGPPDCNPEQHNRNWVCCVGSISSNCTDANVQVIQASSYDRSCKASSDCIAVGVGNACLPCVLACANGTISASARAQYMADVAKTSGWADLQDPTFTGCGCGAEAVPCCVDGQCHADEICNTGALALDAGDASLDAADAAGE